MITKFSAFSTIWSSPYIFYNSWTSKTPFSAIFPISFKPELQWFSWWNLSLLLLKTVPKPMLGKSCPINIETCLFQSQWIQSVLFYISEVTLYNGQLSCRLEETAPLAGGDQNQTILQCDVLTWASICTMASSVQTAPLALAGGDQHQAVPLHILQCAEVVAPSCVDLRKPLLTGASWKRDFQVSGC